MLQMALNTRQIHFKKSIATLDYFMYIKIISQTLVAECGNVRGHDNYVLWHTPSKEMCELGDFRVPFLSWRDTST